MPRSTRDKILDAAERRFAAKGYEATSLGEIADDVGIRGPSLYKHFAGKQALYRAVLERLLHPYFDLLGRLMHPPASAGDAERNLELVARHYYDTPNLARLVQHAALAGGHEVELILREWIIPFLTRAAELTPPPPGVGAEDVIFLVMAFHNMLSGYVTLAPLHRRILGTDPLSPRARERHLKLLKRLAQLLWATPAARQRRR